MIATRNRRRELLRTLERLRGLPERPAVVVVDNGSDDGTASAVRDRFGDVRLVELGRNLGPAARTVGVRLATTALVAFSDDDSWWEPGSLGEAARLFGIHPDLGLIAATVLVGDERRLDPVTAVMRRALAPSSGLPGPPVLGFVACGAVVRRAAFLSVGGFTQSRVGGEEALLAIDLATAGWRLAHVPGVVALHHPSRHRDAGARSTASAHNDLRTAWLRLPLGEAAARTARIARRGVRDRHARRALGLVLREAPWLVRRRRPIPSSLARQVAALEPVP